ncbi:DNA repair protein RadA [Candidatus Neptunochlamydia vexilliferae]|uniref:DNA repair protein RadA n=1 Tax=Candidatus Neptunichlamydia vexilliferae TaxID=1651774 RepID=A0ABS0B041_9BACT|nr:DNA repair protein RadA [Candidatus Neptunochlamydia vexilliferae]MBF5058945.1 DNA repair protein RadA [Candidatus Neptunochlamydia vexilliferae]
MVKQKSVWVCNECGNKQFKWTGSCNICKNWDTLTEELEVPEKQGRFESKTPRTVKPVLIEEVDTKSFKRVNTGYREFDRLMGGGIVEGSLNLIGGEPGIGKSTMLLQLAKRFADQGLTVLYVCGEESAEQTSLRARRLDIKSDRIYLFSETSFSAIRAQVEKLHPDVLIVDSVQIVYKTELSSAPGSVTQVREIAMECMHLAKGNGITTFLIGHVTKSGDLAGPRVLEHIVDTVLEFEGDRQHGYRLMRSIKNRFGPTDDVALFQMEEKGLSEILNPSLTFLEERMTGSPGSVIIPTIEGTRALLIEVQALVAPTSFATSTRRSTGLDQKRLTLLLAVLEKRMGYQLHALDVFVSIAGGMKITEPAIDLGIILAIASCYCNKPIPSDTVVMGEVGLGGEVRSIPRIESRIKEAINMGFKRCILSTKNFKGLNKKLTEKIHLQGVTRVEEAIKLLLG